MADDNANGGPDVVRGMFEVRYELPDCGELDLTRRGSEGLASPGHGVACLREGLRSGHGAELRVLFTTIEGDPITDHVRVLPLRQRANTVEIYQDTTADAFADPDLGGWWHGVCPARASLAQLEDGRPVAC